MPLIKVSYTSWISTKLQKESEVFNIPEDIESVSNLISWLSQKQEPYRSTFFHRHIIFVARNGSVTPHETVLKENDELVFFAPIAGG